jgi:phosphate/sulfate permease
MACLCYKFHPIKIIKASVIAGACILLCAPFYLQKVVSIHGEIAVYILQCAIYIPALSNLINIVGWMKHFPVSRRFTTVATTFGVALALGFATSSYGLIPLTTWFGYYGIWVLFTPIIIGFIWGLNYLKKLEKSSGAYDSYPDEPKIKDTALEEGDFKYELDDEYDAQAIKEVK